MDNEREKYLEICLTCTKSTFDRRKGLVCTLTNEQANFDLNQSCPDYVRDEKFARIHTAVKKRVSAAQSDDSTAAFWRPASIVFIIIGFLLFLSGIVGLLSQIRYGFSAISLLFAAIGLTMLSKGIVEFNKVSRNAKLPSPENKGDFDEFDELDELI
jgi:hypothetical protein